MKKLFYISLLIFSAFTTASIDAFGQIVQPDLPMVCAGSVSTYRVEGLANSIFTWTIKDPNGNPIPASDYIINGDLIEIHWQDSYLGGIYTFSVTEKSIFGCDGVPYEDENAFIMLNTNTFFTPITSNQEFFAACDGNTVELDPGPFSKYLWTINGSTNRTYITTETGTYQVRLVDDSQSCTFDTIQARFNPLPTVWLGNDTILFANQTLELNVDDPLLSTYQWYSNGNIISGEITSSILVDGLSGNRTIKVTITDFNGCQNSDEIKISAADYNNLEIPAAFTPNGDQINDKWYFPKRIDDKDVFNYFDNIEVKVFNRSGKLVWESNKNFVAWDGRDLNGKELPMDSYHYLIQFKIGGKTYTKKGSVTIIR